MVWGCRGNNAGAKRQITSVSGNTATVVVPFLGTVVNDIFLKAPFWAPGGSIAGTAAAAQLTTNLYQVDASIAVDTGAAFVALNYDLRDEGEEGDVNSFVYLHANDHLLAGKPASLS